jgi:omega-hydroxy-beta-dihydromenaquinone-9 sulfotransferase
VTIESPVFVIGTGRCGSTALMDLIAYHPAFAWPSQYTARGLGERAAMVSRVVELPAIGPRLRFTRWAPKHAERYEQWQSCFAGFAEPFRDLVEADVTPRVASRFQRTVRGICRYQGKSRFMTKYTGWSRIGFIRSIFPDARFIHIVRDGRAVAYSYTSMPWWDGWAGVARSRWGALSDTDLDALDRYEGSFVALAALQWKTLVNNITDTSACLPKDDLLLLRYEDVVRDPFGAAYGSIAFAGERGDDPRFEQHLSLAASRIVDPDSRPTPPPWKQELTPRQLEMIEDLCGDELARFDYR